MREGYTVLSAAASHFVVYYSCAVTLAHYSDSTRVRCCFVNVGVRQYFMCLRYNVVDNSVVHLNLI